MLTPDRWLLVQLALHLDAFCSELQAYALERYPQARNLESCIDYQRNLVILPSYDRRVGKSFPTDFDWIRYSEQAQGRTGSEPLDEPDPTPGAMVRVTDQSCGEKGYLVSPLEWGTRGSPGLLSDLAGKAVLRPPSVPRCSADNASP